MKDYNVVIPMSRLEQLEEIETRFNNDEHKVIEEYYIKSYLYLKITTHDGLVHSIDLDNSKDNILFNTSLQPNIISHFGIEETFEEIFNKQTHTLYESLKIENLDRIKKEVEEEYNNLSFSQKFKKLFL